MIVIPAKDESARIAATVTAALTVDPLVVVVDDGSSDDTASVATAAGARVVRHERNRGKAAAMESGAAYAPDEEYVLFLDADLGATASEGAKILDVVRRGDADCAIGVLPPVKGGGHGFVVRLARDGIEAATGWAPTQPLSGQRCLNRRAFRAVLPLADGFGVETAMTIDLLLHGFRVVEVPTDIAHRVTGTSWRDRVHRLRQYRDVRRALRR